MSYKKARDMIKDSGFADIIRKEKRKRYAKSNPLVVFLAVIGAFTVGASIAYAVYRLINPDDFEDDEADLEDYERSDAEE